MKRHIFVIGDLTIDHDIFVTELESRSDSGAVEDRFSVVRRQDTAGSAANSARILSVLNDGDTYLWGIVGNSHWGTFRGILEKSGAIDGASHPIELRGVRDETDPPMNTVTRLLVVSEDQPRVVERRFCRHYDINQVHIPEAKRRQALLYHLDRIQKEKAQLHAIVINDFDRRTLTKRLIESIAVRAGRHRVPLFVDPHCDRADKYHDPTRYAGFKATAILPNLRQWCELVDDRRGADYWRKNLNDAEALQEMAVQSFRHLSNFEYHIVKCDRDGAVLFFPHAEKRQLYALYRIDPVPADKSAPPLQMGCGDVMTAVFALEFPKTNATTDEVLRSIQRANAAVASYREMPWHQMPSRRDVDQKQAKFVWKSRLPDAEITKGVLFLPKESRINMSAWETAIKGHFSRDQTFKTNVQDFMSDILEEWTSGSLKSVVLGAPPGTGKTSIIEAIREACTAKGIESKNMTSTRENVEPLHALKPETFRTTFRAMRNSATGQRLMIIVDEALREPTNTFLKDNAPTLLDAAHAEGVRFIFVSAGFEPKLEDAPEWREFFGRCPRRYYLSNLEERPFDVPYIIAARFFQQCKTLSRLDIAGTFLLAVTDLALKTPEPRVVCDVVDAVLGKFAVEGAEFKVTMDHLPDRYRKQVQMSKGDFGIYEFRR